MPNVEIVIKTKAELEQLKKTGTELETVTRKTKQTGDATVELTGKNRKMLEGFKALGREMPLFGALLNALKNPFTLIGTAGVIAFTKIRQVMREAKEEQRAYNAVVENVRVGIEAYSDLQRSVDAATESQRLLAEQTKGANEFLKQQIEIKGQIVQGEIDILSAEEERQAALIERDVADPVERARKLRENKLRFGARKIALRSALGKEQAAAIDQQIIGEQELQVEAGANVPNEAGLRSAVQGVEKDRSALESALRANRAAFQDYGLFEMALREGGDLNILADASPFSVGQRRRLQELGLVKTSPTLPGGFLDIDKIQGRMPGAESTVAATRDQVDRLRASLNAGIGALPAGVATEADIGPFLSTAEAKAAETQNASYQRMQTLIRMRDKIEFERANQAAVGTIQNQTAGIRGDASIGKAQADEDREMLNLAGQVRGSNNNLSRQILSLLKDILQDGRITEREVQVLKTEMRRQQSSD